MQALPRARHSPAGPSLRRRAIRAVELLLVIGSFIFSIVLPDGEHKNRFLAEYESSLAPDSKRAY